MHAHGCHVALGCSAPVTKVTQQDVLLIGCVLSFVSGFVSLVLMRFLWKAFV